MDNKFIQLAENRMNKVLMEMEKLENMALHRPDISYDQISEYIDAIQNKINEVKIKFERSFGILTGNIIEEIDGEYNFSVVSNCTEIEKIVTKSRLLGSDITTFEGGIVSVKSTGSVTLYSKYQIKLPVDAARLFSCTAFNKIDLTGIDASNTVNMERCFAFSNAKIIKFGEINTSNVTDMSYMFMSTNADIIDINGLVTDNVKNMDGMFLNAAVCELELKNFNTSNVESMASIFSGLDIRTLDISSFDTSKVRNMQSMFKSSCILDIIWGEFNTSNVEDMQWMFSEIHAERMKLETFDTANVRNMSKMFSNADIEYLDISNFVFTNNTNVFAMFSGCKAAEQGNIVINHDFFKALATSSPY